MSETKSRKNASQDENEERGMEGAITENATTGDFEPWCMWLCGWLCGVSLKYNLELQYVRECRRQEAASAAAKVHSHFAI